MTSRPTVCFLTGTLNAFAGAERMTAVIANALAERGYRVRILSLWDQASVFPLHRDIVHDALFASRPSFKRQYFATVAGIRRFVGQQQIDVLVEVDTMLTLFTVPATLGMTVRRIAWEHCHFDEDLGRRARRVARWVAGRFNQAIVVLTQRDQQVWLARVRPRGRVEVIANPLPFPFPAAPSPGTEHCVLAVGRLTRAKGFDVLLQAWSMVAPSAPGWVLKIVGEGEERAALERMALALNLGDAVTMPGVQHRVEDCYRDAAIFCLSSRYEGFGLVLIEAMSFGLGIVSTDCEAGPREILRHGDNALVSANGNPRALAEALKQLIKDEACRRRLGQAARADAMAYSLDRVVGQWIDVLAIDADEAGQRSLQAES
ncbi:glycosyltransferase family 4 protein [Cupriavidus sp. SZY C1]|uniref:glycosyltransferase family 4 protein n=1 Tax=Cupriavidus sp. SZY C1 TaxID=3055037 RepID=UPI0028B63D63|nr:glycosyltransferase family 4 protein [Cupriavidus sp. SZY C1]MDT6960341.1 glycosyltransferase family 4 protein [Cupriavidus sp. SZY C1]